LSGRLIDIDKPYFLAVCVPIKIDRNGARWCDDLWAKDLALHLEYLKDLTLACPHVYSEPSNLDRPLNVAPFDRLKFVELPHPKSLLEALASIPELTRKMWNGIRSAEIVHAGFGGWPISEGWLAIPMGKLQRKFVITNVESSFWRSGRDARWDQKIRSFVIERLNRFCVKVADLRFFTSMAYLEDFLGRSDHLVHHAFVLPATWIDDAIIRTEDQATQDWKNKSGNIRLLFAGRIIADKGVRILLDAAKKAENEFAGNITIVGEGPLTEECREFARQSQSSSLKIELLKPVEYGLPFFQLLRRFDAVIVPSVSDEQPRVIFDAFSQGIPILGSNTGGIIEIIEDGVDGKLFAARDALSLVETLRWASQNRDTLRLMGMSALRKSRQFTHRLMHVKRSEIISSELKPRKLPSGFVDTLS
jgi:glycosyltransferase involved in cell wall biosynthesis